MLKKALTTLLALIMVLGLFASCGGESAPASVVSAESTSEIPATVMETPEIPEPSDEPEETVSAIEDSTVEPAIEAPTNAFYSEHIGVVDYELPMFDNDLELSLFWVQLGAMGGAEQPLKKDVLFWQQVQEKLGLTLNFKQASEAVGNEQYNLMVASEDMTDMIWESNCGAMGATAVYNGGYDKAIEDDVYVDLTELIPEYAPNYWAILQEDENVLRDLSTDEGRLYSISMIYDQPQGVREGPLVRKDYLEATNLDPVTCEDWVEAFKAMKANGVKFPMGASYNGDIRGGLFCNAFGTSGGHAFKVKLETGELVYDGTSQELRDFIEFFNEVYEAGCINPDYAYTQPFDTSLQIAGEVALFGGMDRNLVTYKESYGMDLKAVKMPYPEGAEAPKMYSYEYATQRTSGMKNIVITTACENVEEAIQFLDWFYSTEGAAAVNFGFDEGVSYEVVDGVKQWLPLMKERDENLVNYEIIYSLDEGPGVQLVNKKNPVNEDYVLEAKEIWLDVDTSKAEYSATPILTFTAEESEDMSARNTDISTYVATEISRFMIGENELTDESWNAYVQTVEDMGLEELASFYEAAYQRYDHRGKN